jgi:hypothetical protein
MAKTTVVTAWGKGGTVEKIGISRFKDRKQGHDKNPMAKTYCNWINALTGDGENWVNAQIVEEGAVIDLKSLLPHPDEWAILHLFDDRAIQKIMCKIDSQDLVKALKISPPEIQEKIFNNMSKRASEMLKEDMEYMGPIRKSDAEEAKQKIISIIRYLEDTGEILLPQTGEEHIK